MRLHIRYFVTVAVGTTIIAAVATARAETWPLELKKVVSRYHSSPQRFYVQIGDKEKSRLQFPGVEEQAAAFKRIVNKEPKYESKVPLRSVAKLGSREYAFAIDAVPPKPPTLDPDSAVAKLAEKLLQALPPPLIYNRLYFDFNCNGDLTDEEVVEAKSQPNNPYVQFPRIDIVLDVDGAKLDYSFFFSVSVYTRAVNYAMASLNAAVCREGDVTLEGKKHHVALIDFNSNGRFDDQTTFPAGRQAPGEPLSPQPGDALQIDVDPKRSNVNSRSLYAAAKNNQLPLSKLIELDGRFYDMKVSPTGDQLTLTPTSARLGHLTNPHDGFRATIYSDKGFLKIGGNKDVPVPEGQWKLLSYEIDLPDYQKPVLPPESQKDGAALLALTNSLKAELSSRPRYTRVTAQATADCKPVVVRAGETATLSFGPPFTPVVTAGSLTKDKQLPLSLALIGSGGEKCTGIRIEGGRPPSPEFTITDPEGKVIQQGDFKFG